MVGAVGGRLESMKERDEPRLAPAADAAGSALPDGPMEELDERLLGLLALAWQTSAEEIRRQMSLQHQQGGSPHAAEDDGVVRLDGWRRRHHRRVRVDRRQGRRPARRGRAA
jgi:hypothetical protein